PGREARSGPRRRSVRRARELGRLGRAQVGRAAAPRAQRVPRELPQGAVVEPADREVLRRAVARGARKEVVGGQRTRSNTRTPFHSWPSCVQVVLSTSRSPSSSNGRASSRPTKTS